MTEQPTIDPPERPATVEEINAVKARANALLAEGVSAGDIIAKLVEETGTTKENVEHMLAYLPPQREPIHVTSHEQAAAINVHRTAEEGYVKVGDVI